MRCRRCKAQSSRTKLQCSKPALKGKAACQFHGGLSTGPKSKEGKGRIRATHFKHGEETVEAKAERNAKSLMFRYLTDIGNHCDMFYKQIKARGRPPSGYIQLDLADPEQLAMAVLKTQLGK
nr:HGGxSTG domain-containing protein [Polynucleobacter sp. AP-Ainpum-60-G11]